MKIHRLRIAVAALFLIAAVVCYGLTRRQSILPETGMSSASLTKAGEELAKSEAGLDGWDLTEDGPGDNGSGTKPETEPEPVFNAAPVCYVHICGEVVSPGVYQLAPDSRVFQAVEAAGGLTGDAAQEYLNLAETIKDGMKIVVASKQEVEEAKASGSPLYGAEGLTAGTKDQSGGRINLNTATKEELMTLRGIGQSRAEDIIKYREEHGGFTKPEDIMKISGIKDAAFQKIKDDITV